MPTTNIKKLKLINDFKNVLWITDIHMQASNIDRCRQLFDFIVKLDEKHCFDAAIITGDIYDGKDILRSKCQNLFIKFLESVNYPVLIIPGNHDYEETINAGHYENNQLPNHSLIPLSKLDNVYLIDETTIWEDHNIAFIPYRGNNNRLLSDLKLCLKNKLTKLFMHDGVFGANLGNNYPDDFSLPVKCFRGFKSVFAGHYHAYQKLNNITYLGSPFTQSFGESNEKKFVGALDLVKDKITLIEPDLAQHKTLVITADNVDQLSGIEQNNDLIRVIVSGKKEELQLLEKRVRKSITNDNLKIILKPEIQQVNRINLHESMNELKMLEVYLNNFKTKLDKKQLLKMAQEFMDSD